METAKPNTKSQPQVPQQKLNLTDGPTLEEYLAAGSEYKAENYPPDGYAPIVIKDGNRVQPDGWVSPVIESNPGQQKAQQSEQPPVDETAGASKEPAKPVRKFYHALNSNRYVREGGFQFAFGPYEHVGGMWMGSLEVNDPAQTAVLDALVKGNKHGITELSETEFNECHKKKLAASQSLGTSLLQSEIRPTGLPSVQHAVPLNSEPDPAATVVPPVVDGAGGLQVGKVAETPPK